MTTDDMKQPNILVTGKYLIFIDFSAWRKLLFLTSDPYTAPDCAPNSPFQIISLVYFVF